MLQDKTLSPWDFAVIGMALAVSAAIGIYFKFFAGKQKTTQEFLMAGKNMSCVPVIFSLCVTSLSSAIMLGGPAEVYLYGTQVFIVSVGWAVGIVLTAFITLPIFFYLRVNTAYEYLEMRYGKLARLTASAIFLLQTLLYMAIALYAPCLALSAVTDLTTNTSIVLFGLICTFYCALGGLKAVLWTDVFQALLMICPLLAVFFQGIKEVGGLGEIFAIASKGGRLIFFNFSCDMFTRYTFWNSFLRGFSMAFGIYGVSQLQVQRLLSIKHFAKARSALFWNTAPSTAFLGLCYILGVVLFAVFHDCDPIVDMNNGLTKYDQHIPKLQAKDQATWWDTLGKLQQTLRRAAQSLFAYQQMDKEAMHNYMMSGVTGLCVAGIFSGSLSTISSGVNSMSAVTMMDFIKPFSLKTLNETRDVLLARILALVYGSACIGLAILASKFHSVVQMVAVFFGMGEAPLIALFLLGMLTVKTNEKGAIIGVIAGVLLTGWLGFGTIINGTKSVQLPISTEGCLANLNSSVGINGSSLSIPNSVINLITTNSPLQNSSQPFILYSLSYMWTPSLGCLSTLIVGYIASLFFGCRSTTKVNRELICPALRKWIVEPYPQLKKNPKKKEPSKVVQTRFNTQDFN